MCNCNNKGDNITEYLIDESNPLKNDNIIQDVMSRVKLPNLKDINLSLKREKTFQHTKMLTLVIKLQKSFRIFRTLKRNMSNANLVRKIL